MFQKLWKLIDGVAPDELADPRDSGVILHLEQDACALVLALQRRETRLGVHAHAAQLQAIELLAVEPDAALAEEDWATVFEFDGDHRH